MSELTKSFEQDFPLPFHIEEDETGQLRTLCPASGTAFMDFGIVEGPLDFDGYDVQEYLVKCANLMPECIKVLRQARDGLYRACMNCTNGELHDCPVCRANGVDERIDALLAKLEREVEDYERVD